MKHLALALAVLTLALNASSSKAAEFYMPENGINQLFVYPQEGFDVNVRVVYQALNTDESHRNYKKCTRRRSFNEVLRGEKRPPLKVETFAKKVSVKDDQGEDPYLIFKAPGEYVSKKDCDFRLRYVYLDVKYEDKDIATLSINGTEKGLKKSQLVECDPSRRSLKCGENVIRLHVDENGVGEIEIREEV